MYLLEQQGAADGIYEGNLAFWGTPNGSANGNFGNTSTLHNGTSNALFVGGNANREDFSNLININWNGWDGYGL